MSSGDPRLRPPALDPSAPLSRRSVLKGAAGAAGALTLPAALAACGSDDSSSKSGSSGGGGAKGPSGTVTVGSNASDAVPKKSYVKVFSNFEQQNSGVKLKVN